MASKAEKLRSRFGGSFRESVGGGEGSGPNIVEHPTRNKKFEGTTRAKGFQTIPLSKIVADAQHREIFDEEELRELADSMSSGGLIAPILVRWENRRASYVIIAGERRYRAATILGWKTITCDVRPDDISEGEIAELQLAENHARKNLNPIELAKAFKDVIEKNGYTTRDLAKRVGINETTVMRHIRLLTLDPSVQSDIVAGRISFGVAREAARLKDKEEQAAFIEEARTKGISAAEAQKRVSAATKQRKSGRKKQSKERIFSKTIKTEAGEVIAKIRGAKSPSNADVKRALELALTQL
ncbi:ParB/RepB/Spo0J family partition protein [Crateriforma conspicua]|uniref:ParB/RepB/Spo0J family partition protein n=1 Tax=Crateriforma conspicua TaxID=2527996 RepID=UPI00118A0C14|nr:ParB/RepB/Spo0J family partition protein [Crateriforma conspicua]QDV66078.1 Nucleoid occlusion protein [Crateriforma conspicua]